MSILNLFPARIRFVNADGTLTTEALRMLAVLVERVGGMLGDTGADVFATVEPGPAGTAPDVVQQVPADRALPDVVQQAAPSSDLAADLIMQQTPYSPGTALQLVNYSFSLKDTAVVPGSYGDATHVAKLTIDQQGRITIAESVPITFPSGANYTGSLTGKTVTITNGIITSVV